ncbi:MAG: magnesium chelatase subunit D family protein [Desulfomonile tiedjei]|nr:magnesium chelatase subunit D family protein [Desulfomonile tiedjei]
MEQELAEPEKSQPIYPFSAIVGQDAMKLALILNAINPSVGGLLIRGERGTAKSTAVRALKSVLPEIEVVADCPYSCDPKDTPDQCRSCRNDLGNSRSGFKTAELELDTEASQTTPLSLFSTMVQNHGSPARNAGLGRGPGPLGVGPYLTSIDSSIHEGLGGVKEGYRPARSSFCKKGLPGNSVQELADFDTVSKRRKVRVVELPLNATEEMIVGGLDFSASIRDGKRVFQPGLMARANRGIMYIDEVNLLPDHLVDVILDVCASGENVVQREGVSHRHPARFILIGTMNPEEGELRPQLLDRFGLCVDVSGESDLESRVEVLRRRDTFDRTSRDFLKAFEREEKNLGRKIAHARKILPRITLSPLLEGSIVEICVQHNVAGHRADIVIANAARALAAYEGRGEVTLEDVRHAAILALPHRSRERTAATDSAQSGPAYNPGRVRTIWDHFEEYPEQEPSQGPSRDSRMDTIEFGPVRKPIRRYDYPEAFFDIGPTFKVREIGHRPDKLCRQGSGKRSRTRTRHKQGRYVGCTSARLTNDISLDATLRAAAPHQLTRDSTNGLLVTIRDEDIREKLRETRTGNFLLFIVDASGSMAAKGRMVASKGAIMSLLKDAYQKRDRVAMISFRQQEAFVNLPPTASIYLAGKLLKELPVGGKTPLAAGLHKGQALLRNVLLKDPACKPILIILTDGKANESVGKGDPFWEALSVAKGIALDKRVKSIVVDAEEDRGFRYGLSARLAEVLHADYFTIKDLRADTLLQIVRSGV